MSSRQWGNYTEGEMMQDEGGGRRAAGQDGGRGGRAAGREEGGSVCTSGRGEDGRSSHWPRRRRRRLLSRLRGNKGAVEPLAETEAAAFAPLGEARAVGRDGGGGAELLVRRRRGG